MRYFIDKTKLRILDFIFISLCFALVFCWIVALYLQIHINAWVTTVLHVFALLFALGGNHLKTKIREGKKKVELEDHLIE